MRKNEHTLDAVAQELASTSGWSEPQARAVISLLQQAAAKQMESEAVSTAAKIRKAKSLATRKLMEKYRVLKLSIEAGTESAINLLDDTEIQRLMDREESARTQQVTSVALQAAGNRVLWLRLNAALEELKEICSKNSNPKIRRAYPLLYERYIAAEEKNGIEIAALYHIEERTLYDGIQEGIILLSQILFGMSSAEDFVATHSYLF